MEKNPFKYHKIPNIYKRNSRGQITRELQDSVLFFNNLKFVPEIKIDGTNITIYYDWNKVHIYGRNYKEIQFKELNKFLHDKFAHRGFEELMEQEFWDKKVILYWEWIHPKVNSFCKMYWDNADFILFDVRIWDKFLWRENIRDIGRKLNINIVPILNIGDTLHNILSYKRPNDLLAKERTGNIVPAEWIVVKPAIPLYTNKERIVYKIKDFKK